MEMYAKLSVKTYCFNMANSYLVAQTKNYEHWYLITRLKTNVFFFIKSCVISILISLKICTFIIQFLCENYHFLLKVIKSL